MKLFPFILKVLGLVHWVRQNLRRTWAGDVSGQDLLEIKEHLEFGEGS